MNNLDNHKPCQNWIADKPAGDQSMQYTRLNLGNIGIIVHKVKIDLGMDGLWPETPSWTTTRFGRIGNWKAYLVISPHNVQTIGTKSGWTQLNQKPHNSVCFVGTIVAIKFDYVSDILYSLCLL